MRWQRVRGLLHALFAIGVGHRAHEATLHFGVEEGLRQRVGALKELDLLDGDDFPVHLGIDGNTDGTG